jgi:hypothetical protein
MFENLKHLISLSHFLSLSRGIDVKVVVDSKSIEGSVFATSIESTSLPDNNTAFEQRTEKSYDSETDEDSLYGSETIELDEFPPIQQLLLKPYILFLSRHIIPDLHVDFGLAMDHHLSWDESGKWAAHFKDLYNRLTVTSETEAQLLHAAMKRITMLNDYEGCDERLQKMISSQKDTVWDDDSRALRTVLVTAMSYDDGFESYGEKLLIQPSDLKHYILFLSRHIIPDLHVDFGLAMDHHLSWDESGKWAAHFKDLYNRLTVTSETEAQLLHAAMKRITMLNDYEGCDERLQKMISSQKDTVWDDDSRALRTVLVTAMSYDDGFESYGDNPFAIMVTLSLLVNLTSSRMALRLIPSVLLV